MKPYLLILLTLCTLGCDKTDPDPTPSFTPGYYFYCKVGGKEFVPAKHTGVGGSKTTTAYVNRDYIFITSLSELNEYVTIKVDNRISKYQFNLKTADTLNNNSYNFAYYKKNATALNEANTDSMHTGILTINFIDTVNKIIDGSFFFEAYDTLTHETYSISDGRFNLFFK